MTSANGRRGRLRSTVFAPAADHDAVRDERPFNVVVIPTVDNRPAIAAAYGRMERAERLSERALDFAALPFANTDPVVTGKIRSLLLDIDHGRYHDECLLDDLESEHGMLAPTQETWNALDEDSRQDIVERYVTVDCINGEWEFNPWGSLVESNCPGYFNAARD